MPDKKEFILEGNKRLCEERGYHVYDMVDNTKLSLCEQCNVCGAKAEYVKDDDGKIDEKRWAKNHEVDLLQPTDKRFWEVYGEPKVPDVKPDTDFYDKIIQEANEQGADPYQELKNSGFIM